MTTDQIARGLEGINVAATKLCRIDGQKGELVYAGYDIYELAERSTFEEVVFLLWNLRLPSRAELQELKAHLVEERALDDIVERLLREPARGAPHANAEITVEAIGAPRSEVERAGDGPAQDHGRSAHGEDGERHRRLPPDADEPAHRRPREDLGHAANFLYMLTGTEPSELHARVFDVALVLHAEHEMNASTFSAMVTASTLSDMYSATASAMGH
jgi:citrate synthase